MKSCSICGKKQAEEIPILCPGCNSILYLCTDCKDKPLIQCPSCGKTFENEKEEKI